MFLATSIATPPAGAQKTTKVRTTKVKPEKVTAEADVANSSSYPVIANELALLAKETVLADDRFSTFRVAETKAGYRTATSFLVERRDVVIRENDVTGAHHRKNRVFDSS